MSTRANIIIKDDSSKLIFYRHSDGYPSCTGKSLAKFVRGYASKYRDNVTQSAGWLIIHGHQEYESRDSLLGRSSMYDWKVGAYEPSDSLSSDVDYIYTIDLMHQLLTCRRTTSKYWDDPTLENTQPCTDFQQISFKVGAA